jgi:hypothetical protein
VGDQVEPAGENDLQSRSRNVGTPAQGHQRPTSQPPTLDPNSTDDAIGFGERRHEEDAAGAHEHKGDAEPVGARNGPGRRRSVEIAGRLVFWLVFGVIIGLLPIALLAIKDYMDAPHMISIETILGNGELFVVSAVVCAGAVGELLSVRSGHWFIKLVTVPFAGCCVLCLCGNAAAFALTSGSAEHQAASLSMILFLPSIATSAFCVGRAAA